jgi:hypothetical protein
METNYDYTETIKFKHHQSPAIYDGITGEYKQVKTKNKLPEGKVKYQEKGMTDSFSKLNNKILDYLLDVFNPIEIKMIIKMIELSEFNSNSLDPLNNDYSLRELAIFFGVSRDRIKTYLDHLFKMGVYAQFKVYADGKKEFWILNPYIAWQGELIDSGLKANFKNTKIELYLRKLKDK